MATIGETLREARNKKGASEAIAAKAVKIKLERLRDLEEDRYDTFPAQVYVRSFLRQYADYLGLDGAAILQRFTEENTPPEQKPVFEITEEQRNHSTHSPIQKHVPIQPKRSAFTQTGITVLVAIPVIIGILIGCAWLIMNSQPPETPSITEPTPPPSSETPMEKMIETPALDLAPKPPENPDSAFAPASTPALSLTNHPSVDAHPIQ
jgi:cytoskeletal protein RodZ